MKKVTIFSIIIILIIVIISFFLFFKNSNNYNKLNPNVNSQNFEKSLEDCMNIPLSEDGWEGHLCIRNISVLSGKSEYCDKILEYSDNQYTQTNYNLCINEVMIFSNLIYLVEGCQDMSGKISYSGLVLDIHYKDPTCITNIAVENKNTGICDYISPSGGSSGVGPYYDCLTEVYIAIGDVENCGQLKVGSKYCEDSILNKTAE